MPDRRTVLQLGVAASSAPALDLAARVVPAFATTAGPLEFYKVVFDERFEDSRAFAAEFERRGISAAGIRGDVTQLWYDDLYHRWAREPAPIAGLTERGALFCLEELARGVGMRVLFRADHLVDADGAAVHRAAAPALLAQATEELVPSRAFGRIMASFACHCAPGMSAPAAAQMGGGPFSPAGGTALVSWVIAPVARV